MAIVIGIAGDDRALQRADDIRVVGMVFAAVHVLQHAARLEHRVLVVGVAHALALLAFEIGEARAADARRRAGEAEFDNVAIEPDDLEQLCAAIAGDGRDTHLRQDL